MRKITRICTLVLAACVSVAITNNVFAAQSNFTDSNGVTWVYDVDKTGDDPVIVIGFKDAPANATTVAVPTLSEVKTKLEDPDLAGVDTYFIDNILEATESYTVPLNLNKVDMTNAADVQIRNLAPLFENNTNEIELVFGEGVIITDDYSMDKPGTFSSGASEPGAFEGMTLKLTNLENVKYIGWRAFENTTLNNTSITITENQTLGGRVFKGSNVTSLNLNTEEIGDSICRGCNSLSSLTIGNNVKTIYGGAFMDTPNLQQSFDTKNVTKIGSQAFNRSAITGLTFGNDIELIQAGAFMNTNLGSLNFTGINPRLMVAAFYNAGLNTVNLGELEYIDTANFAKNNIKSIYLPKTISYLGYAAFVDNPIKDVTIAYDPVRASSAPFREQLGGSAGSTVTGLCDYGSCELGIYPSEASVSTNATVEKLTLIAPYGENDELPEYRRSPSDYYGSSYISGFNNIKNFIPGSYFEDFAPNIDEITIGEGYEYIETQAFFAPCTGGNSGCDSATNISGRHNQKDAAGNPISATPSKLSLPSTLKGVGANAFGAALNNPALQLENLPQSLVYVGPGAFAHSPYFTINHLDLPNLKYAGDNSFFTVNIKNLTIHDGIQTIGHGAFCGGHNLKNITIDTDIFGKNANGYNIMTGSGFLDVFIGSIYSTIDNWVTAPETVYDNHSYGIGYEFHLDKIKFTSKATTQKGDDPYMERLYVDEFDISETSWTSIGRHTFYRAKIKTIKLPTTITSINDEAFYAAEIENPITLPEGVTTIGNRAFWGQLTASEIEEIGRVPGSPAADQEKIQVKIANLPSTITSIGEYAFYKNAGITADINLPNLTRLGNESFYGTNVRDITLGNNITTIGANIFYDVPTLRNVTIDVNLYDATRNPYAASGSTYSSFFGTFGNGQNNFGTITFGANAGEPDFSLAEYEDDVLVTRYCNGFETCDKKWAYFYGINADKVDLSATNWKALSPSMFQDSDINNIVLPSSLEIVNEDTFFQASLGDVQLPSTLKTIKHEGFQSATANISELPEGLETIESSAFYAADVTDDLVIPSTVTTLGTDAFNAGPETVYYSTITLKPNLTFSNTENNLMHQIFWGSKVDKMIIESANLPALAANVGEGQQEFWNMPFSELVIKNLPGISWGAFDSCKYLVSVDASEDSTLRAIGNEAFLNAEKLHIINFAPSLKNEEVTVGQNAFKGTAFTTMGDSSKEFDLTAALFDGSAGYAFSGMQKLVSVDVPRSYSHATIPKASFYDDTELVEANIDYKITDMGDDAFANDNKLERIFIWGNTVVEDLDLENYTKPDYYGHGGDGDSPRRGVSEEGLTIPATTDIYAYSVSPTEAYAGEPRDNLEGNFYPLDEVIYITSNKPRVHINDEADDFDKSDLIVYAMRRDGLILESDSWGDYDGVVYPRSESDLTFERMPQVMANNPVFGTIWDTPVPIDELDFGNENFDEIDFEFITDGDTPEDVRLVNIVYTDGYTRGVPDTDIDPYANSIIDDIIEDLTNNPLTFAGYIVTYIAASALLMGAIIVVAKSMKR
jgi:hypothetical protein